MTKAQNYLLLINAIKQLRILKKKKYEIITLTKQIVNQYINIYKSSFYKSFSIFSCNQPFLSCCQLLLLIWILVLTSLV